MTDSTSQGATDATVPETEPVPIRTLLLNAMRWVREEGNEVNSSSLNIDLLDAIFDTLGVTILALIVTPSRDREAAWLKYVSAQTERGRRVDVFHSLLIEHVLDALDGVVLEDVALASKILQPPKFAVPEAAAKASRCACSTEQQNVPGDVSIPSPLQPAPLPDQEENDDEPSE